MFAARIIAGRRFSVDIYFAFSLTLVQARHVDRFRDITAYAVDAAFDICLLRRYAPLFFAYTRYYAGDAAFLRRF